MHDFFNEQVRFVINFFELANLSLFEQHSLAESAHHPYSWHQILDIGLILIVVVADFVAKFFIFVTTAQDINFATASAAYSNFDRVRGVI